MVCYYSLLFWQCISCLLITISSSVSGVRYYAAVTSGNIDKVKQAISLGKHLEDRDGFALALAVERGHYDIVKLLIDSGVSPNSYGLAKTSAFTLSVLDRNKEIAMLLLARGADIDSIDVFRETALIKAVVMPNCLSIIKWLLINGATVNAISKDGNTALSQAILSGDIYIIKLLLDAGADPNLSGKESEALVITCLNLKNKAIAKLLFAAGTIIPRINGNSILSKEVDAFASNGRKLYLEIFLSVQIGFFRNLNNISRLGYTLNIIDEKGNSPLHHAVLKNDKFTIVTLLGNNPLLIMRRDRKGLTPIELAIEIECFDLVKLFTVLALPIDRR